MLPPQLGSSLNSSLRHRSVAGSLPLSLRLCPNSIVLSGIAISQSRNFWCGRRTIDYTSHIDPMFHRFTRYRTLKTRAKLLNKIRRREQWDIPGAKTFFASRHIRLASHWNGSARSRWIRYNENDEAKPDDKEATQDGDQYELNKREKEWKEQMEKMRERIDKDPYEAVFGKRFEPFWSPLVPSWMREEMGLQGWCKGKDVSKTKLPSDTATMQSNVNGRHISAAPEPQISAFSATGQQVKKETDTDSNDGPPNGQLTNYSYSSSTLWDSVTQKARREEWDSVSGQVRRYEYDPISNRMVQINSPPTIEAAKSEKPSTSPTADLSKAASEAPKDVRTVSVPVETVDSVRKAIHVPTNAVDSAPKTSVYFPSLLNTSSTPNSSASILPRQATEKDLDSLTADDIRSSMGKSRVERDSANGQSKVDLTRNEWDRAETRFMLDRERDALMQRKARMLRDEHGIFHIGKHTRDLQRLDSRIAEVNQQMEDLDSTQSSRNPLNNFDDLKRRLSSRTQSSPTAHSTILTAVKPVQRTDPPRRLQTSLEHMQSKQVEEIEEPDDSAAHESTGDRIVYQVSNIPKGWHTQAETLQADRVKRTSETASKPKLQVPRWIDEMNARRARFEAKKVEAKALNAEQNAKMQRADSMLDAEVQEQKLRMQAHESRAAHERHIPATKLNKAEDANHISTEAPSLISNEQRYVQKIRDLRKELDIAFKQSSVQAEKHVERIRSLERELGGAQTNNKPSTTGVNSEERERYVRKIRALRQELDATFKQSSINAEMHVERIRALERELDDARNPSKKSPGTSEPVEVMRAEGDFCTNITKFAKDSSKWYKRPAYVPTVTAGTGSSALTNTTQEESDRALVREVRDIYEGKYGTIDTDHVQSAPAPVKVQEPRNQQGQVYEAEVDPNLGEALDTFENDRTYRFKNESLENRIALEERKAHEGQALTTTPASLNKPRRIIPEGLPLNQASYDPLFAEPSNSIPTGEHDLAPKVPTYESSETAQAKSEEWGIKWEEPPVYKILAYDSGNDLFSSAITSSNFTGKESPMSIQQALSQLYQPARFVSHFSELQKENFQVVDATKDLLVFKKVKSPSRPAPEETRPAANLQDHGLANPSSSPPQTGKRNNPSTIAYHGINPIDGTSWPLPEKPSTGDFASPTGFVGDRWDAIEPSWLPGKKIISDTTTASNPLRDQDDFPVQLPRVKREERVFTGTRLGERSREKERRRRRHHHEPSPEQVREMRSKWRSYRARTRWVIGVGLGAAGVAYGIGALAEKKERKDLERWQQILEGKRTRWE